MNREYASEVDTVIGSDADYNAMKRVSWRWECQCTPADFPPADVPPTLVRKPASDGKRSNVDNDGSTPNLAQWSIGCHICHKSKLCSDWGHNVDVMAVLWPFYGRL